MQKLFYTLFLLLICMIFSSCRGSSGQKAMKMAKEYIGKTVNGTKKAHLEKRADDIASVKFVKVRCTACSGTGYTNYSKCDNCDGAGWVYKVERR